MSFSIEKILLIDHFCSALLEQYGVESAENLHGFMVDLGKVLEENPSLRRFILSPRTSSNRMNRFLTGGADDIPSIAISCISIMAEFKLLGDLSRVKGRLHLAIMRKKGIVKVDIFSAKKLEKNDIKTIEINLASLGLKEYVLENQVDPSLLKGYKMRWNNQIYDRSLKKQLDELKNTLMGVKV
jgi:F-type H+-transporting ATPase subunit delta